MGRPRLEAFVEAFFARLLEDPVLGPYFRDLPDPARHLARFTDFWWIALGGESRDPPLIDMVGAHRHLKLSRALINRWLGLFAETAHTHLPVHLAEPLVHMAQGIGRRLEHVLAR